MTDSSGLEDFEPFDPAQEPAATEAGEMAGQFEEFDVVAQPVPAGDEVGIETLGELAESENQLRSVLAARDKAEQRLMPQQGGLLGAMARDGTAGVGNVVGVGIAEKVIGGVPTGHLGVTVFVKEKVAPRKVSDEALVPDSIGGV